MTRARFAQLLRELADGPPDLLRAALLSAAAAIDDEQAPAVSARKSKPRRRSRTVTPRPEPGVKFDDLALERARRMVGK